MTVYLQTVEPVSLNLISALNETQTSLLITDMNQQQAGKTPAMTVNLGRVKGQLDPTFSRDQDHSQDNRKCKIILGINVEK